MVELEVETNGPLEEANFEVGDDVDDAAFENEKCGICMDIIIDRGVLDCCQHWFCFACIDNWAAVTNICPLCQKEFQLITCIPVYDTIGSCKADEESFPRDDDWCIQGNCNTLSFPSYYIDENAIICLDGDGCKIRNGLVANEENLNLDTSIACDSCDLWYHAHCVGFVPESSSNSSWLCPRCIIDDVPPESDCISTQRRSNQFDPDTTGHESSVDVALSGKVSVSVADAGETAVVVSMVERMEWTQESSGKLLGVSGVVDPETETFQSNSNATSSMMKSQLQETANTQPNIGAQESLLGLLSSQETPLTLHCDSLAQSELVTNSDDNANFESNVSDRCGVPAQPSIQPCIASVPSESESNIDHHPGLSVRSSLSVESMIDGATENQVTGNVQQHNSAEPSLSGIKRKCISSMNHVEKYNCTENEDGEARAKMETKLSLKKARPEEKSQMSTQKCQVQDSALKIFPKNSSLPAISESYKLHGDQEREAGTSDIMSIVRGTDQKSSEGHQCPKSSDKSTRDKENAAGLRVKKIMRRATEDEESSVLVQKLRQEIREAVQNKIREAVHNKDEIDLGKNIFDPKLLSAFRAAIAGPRTEPVQKLSPSIVRVKRSILPKGKIRENLTKKIYGTASGRRRRAWDRDWEIEFWKHRCLRTSKPEKVETLKLVLDLLNKGSEMEQESEMDTANPILSRLYLADTSVFPRKDDIRPLSVLTGVNDQKKKEHKMVEKESIAIHDHCLVQTPSESKARRDLAEMSNPSLDNKGKKSCAPSLKVGATCRNVHPNDSTNRANSISLSSSSKIKSQTEKEMAAKSEEVKIDKRKWALEILARKTARESKDKSQGKQENIAVLKGNYPLLVQLPSDMRPILAPSHHNKVPTSIRQAQLYRLTEHFLRTANLPVIRRTAVTELAVADAINIEREIADRSNSKLVYVNLCSQVLSQNANNKNASGALESKPSPPSADTTRTTEVTLEDTPSDSTVEEALRMAGLLSDSPPNSPSCLTKNLNDNDPTEKVGEEEGPENVFDMDSHPELDIYGDFEYDLDDEDYIGTSALRASKLQPEQGDLKMKVIFSTLNAEKTKNDQDSKDNGQLQTVEAPMGSSCVLKYEKNGSLGISTLEVQGNAACLPPETLEDEGNEELSLAECEELYGPDKKPLAERFPQITPREPDKMVGDMASTEKIAFSENESCKPNLEVRSSNVATDSCAENTSITGRFVADHNSSGGENSPNLSSMSQNIQRKELKCNDEDSSLTHSISKKVEAYIKEHIRPLCKSGVITAEQYRWAVGKTTEKVMKYHSKAKNANFIIKEGEKVKKLAEQYVEAAQQKGRMENSS